MCSKSITAVLAKWPSLTGGASEIQKDCFGIAEPSRQKKKMCRVELAWLIEIQNVVWTEAIKISTSSAQPLTDYT